MMKKPHRRYTHDMLLYESFFVSIINALLVSFMPPLILPILIVTDEVAFSYDFVMIVLASMQMVFVTAFCVNFFYYTLLVRTKRVVSYILCVLASCALAFLVVSGNPMFDLSKTHDIMIVAVWFTMLALILLANRTGWLAHPDHRYDHEAWVYRHELTDGHDDETRPDPHDAALHHIYIDHHDEDAPERKNKQVDLEQDPKRASRPM